MEKLADLPTPALITLGFVLAIIMGVRFLGLWQGERTSPSKSPAAAQVAAVIVDPTALNNATAALNRHTAVIEQQVEVQKHICHAIRGVGDQLEEVAKEMLIHREIGRRN